MPLRSNSGGNSAIPTHSGRYISKQPISLENTRLKYGWLWGPRRYGCSSSEEERWLRWGFLVHSAENSHLGRIRDLARVEDSWNIELIIQHFGQPIMDAINNEQEAITFGKDTIRWSATSSGVFTLRSAWEVSRQWQEVHGCFKHIWGAWMPGKWSILLWRLLHNKLPTDYNVARLRFSLASQCQCCTKSETSSTTAN